MNSPAQRHVFVSYSRANSGFADRLMHDLQTHGIGVWIDHDGIQPGTPNWEHAIREAIDDAFAIVFVASPASAQSSAVHGELSIAADAGRAILPVWADGERWSSCAPLEMSRSQYIDLRAEGYDAQVPDLIAALEKLRPAHMILDQTTPPHGYFTVLLGAFGEHASVAFKTSAFSSMRQFTDVLFTQYLRGAVAPFSYGSQWVLASDAGMEQKWLDLRRLCLPFAWFGLTKAQQKQPLVTIDPHWADGSLASFGIQSNSSWQVMKAPTTFFAIVTNEPFLGSVLESLMEERLGKIIEMILTDGKWEEPNAVHQAYRYTFVCSYDRKGRPGWVFIPAMRDFYTEFAV